MANTNTLKTLTQTTYDSVEGYRSAMEKAESPQLKQALERRYNERGQTLNQLNSKLQQFGEDPITSASMSGQVHQAFLSISETLEGGDEAAAERVEEGEDYIAGQFRDALNDEQLDAQLKPVIQSAYNEISAGERFGDMIERQYA